MWGSRFGHERARAVALESQALRESVQRPRKTSQVGREQAEGTTMTSEKVEHGDHQQGGEKLQRTLKNRHIQLIAIGGAIGTGLFMGSGKTISVAGPSILLVYMIIGAVLFLFMRTLG